MKSQELQQRLDALKEKVKPLMQEISSLERELSDARSIEWITANNVRREDIITPDDEGLPYFGHITKFVEYLHATGCSKKWVAWNHTIYRTSDLLRGFMDYDNSPGKLEHVK